MTARKTSSAPASRPTAAREPLFSVGVIRGLLGGDAESVIQKIKSRRIRGGFDIARPGARAAALRVPAAAVRDFQDGGRRVGTLQHCVALALPHSGCTIAARELAKHWMCSRAHVCQLGELRLLQPARKPAGQRATLFTRASVIRFVRQRMAALADSAARPDSTRPRTLGNQTL